MSAAQGLALVGLTWLIIGVVIGFAMRRRGHDFWVWLSMGAVLGPLAIPLTIERARFHPIDYRNPTPLHGGGRFDVLAGIDGSPESVAAVKSALALFGGYVTSLTLAKVLDYDSGGTFTGAEVQVEARGQLKEASRAIAFQPVYTRLLFGRADRALVEYATQSGIELLVVGARGHGMSEALFGSVTARLVGGYRLPVFVGPRDWVTNEVDQQAQAEVEQLT